MEENTRVAGQTTKRTELASSYGPMGRNTTADGRKENSMERASTKLQMGLRRKAFGTRGKGLSGSTRLFTCKHKNFHSELN